VSTTCVAIGGIWPAPRMLATVGMRLVADDVQAMVIPGCGHWVAEQAPDELLTVLTAFLAPYRAAAAHALSAQDAEA